MMDSGKGVLFNCMPNIPMTALEDETLRALVKAGSGFAAAADEVLLEMRHVQWRQSTVVRLLQSLVRKGYVFYIAGEGDDEADLYVPCAVRGRAFKVNTVMEQP
jgi:predicted transcriptional regulator